jgi:hypothetical protein
MGALNVLEKRWSVMRVSSDAVHVGHGRGAVCYICDGVGDIKERVKVAKAICKAHNAARKRKQKA